MLKFTATDFLRREDPTGIAADAKEGKVKLFYLADYIGQDADHLWTMRTARCSIYSTMNYQAIKGYRTARYPGLIKALDALLAIESGKLSGAVGWLDGSNDSAFALINDAKGEPFQYFVFSRDDETDKWTVKAAQKTGPEWAEMSYDNNAYELLALMPVLMADAEFATEYSVLRDYVKSGALQPGDESTWERLHVLSGNAYAHLVGPVGNLTEEAKELALSVKMPCAFFAEPEMPDMTGGFLSDAHVLWGSGLVAAQSPTVQKDDINAMFVTKQDWNEDEELLIPRIGNEYVKPSYFDGILNDYKNSLLDPSIPTQNTFLLYGEAGGGKSAAARALAAALHKPLVIVGLDPDFEKDDFVGRMVPASAVLSSGSAQQQQGQKSLEQLLMAHPDMLDTLPESSRKALLDQIGLQEDSLWLQAVRANPGLFAGMDAQTLEAMKVVCGDADMALQKAKSAPGFVSVDTDFNKGLERGYVIEIQEPTLARPGVMAALNSLLAEGEMLLPNGRRIRRNPECVIVITTNVSYAGCDTMNESVISRAATAVHVERPTVAEMAQRAMAVCHITDELDLVSGGTKRSSKEVVTEMARIVDQIASTMLSDGIRNGQCDMRSLINWVAAAKHADPASTFKFKVEDKASLDDAAFRGEVRSVLANSFLAPKKRSKKR